MSALQRYEIFLKLPDKKLVSLEDADTLDQAKARVIELTRMFPGEYVILDRHTSDLIVPFNPEKPPGF